MTEPMTTTAAKPKPRRIIKCAPPAWLPKELVARLGACSSITFEFSAAERQVLRRRKIEDPSVWATRHRVLRMSSIPGKWKHIFAPYLATLMDACRYPGVETAIICKSPQTAGSEAGLNLLGHAADHFPGPALIVYPDRDTAKEVARDRLLPMFEDSPRLRQHLTRSLGDESSIRINLRHMPIYLGWSGSVSRLGSKPIRLLVLDEMDKYAHSTKEANSDVLAEKRTITWEGRRRLILKISTPTVETGPIWLAWTEEAHARFLWQVLCPVCGGKQVMDFDSIKWPENVREPELVLKDKLAAYQCQHCPALWDDSARNQAVRAGSWVERDSGLELFAHLAAHRPVKIGFHVPAWVSYFVSLSAVAHAFLKYNKSNRLADLKDFMNQYKAEPWAEVRAERDEDSILAHCDDRPRGVVPGPINGVPRVAALVAGIDTQAKYFRYVIRAFGYGSSEESWLVQAGSAPTFAALDDIIWRSVYTDASGQEYRVKVGVIDAMGTRTRAVYAWCARHGARAMAYQGKQNLATPVAYSPIEFFPDAKGTKIKIPGGLLLRRVDTTFFKGDLAEKLGITPGDPGSFWLHSGKVERELTAEAGGLLAEYAREMCAEVFNPEKLIWENPRGRPNHYWDCEVMALVGAWELGLRNRKAPFLETDKKQVKPQNQQRRILTGAGDRLAALRRR